MEKLLFSAVWLLLYWYYTEQIGTIQKGKGRRAAAFGLAAGMLALSVWLPVSVTWILISILLLLYDLFFDGEQIRTQWWRILLPGIVFSLVLCFPARLLYAVNGPVLFLLFLLLAQKRDFLRLGSAFLTAAIYGILSFLLWSAASDEAGRMADSGTRQLLLWIGILLEVLLFLALEGTLYSYKTGFEHQAERFQKDVMGHQYEEIKSIYMNMRGWRHDYHNHLGDEGSARSGKYEGSEAISGRTGAGSGSGGYLYQIRQPDGGRDFKQQAFPGTTEKDRKAREPFSD